MTRASKKRARRRLRVWEQGRRWTWVQMQNGITIRCTGPVHPFVGAAEAMRIAAKLLPDAVEPWPMMIGGEWVADEPPVG